MSTPGTKHRIVVWRQWYASDGHQLQPTVIKGAARHGTPRWQVDCLTCQRSLGEYAGEREAREALCINEMQEQIEAKNQA